MSDILPSFLTRVIPDNDLHARWLNTLSFMENCGAKKISGCQHPFLVTEIILKHAAEEARHGYFLKKQLSKLTAQPPATYESQYLLAAVQTTRYLDQLDVRICRILKKELNARGDKLRYGAYLLVTYAIEVRADDIYPIYQELLTKHQSKVNVKSIIAEETEHLKEMESGISAFFEHPAELMERVRSIEQELYHEWLLALHQAVPAG